MMPELDEGVRQRMTLRFGARAGPWLHRLPGELHRLAVAWRLESCTVIPRGSMSVVCRCRLADGRGAVLKVSPDRARIATEAAALQLWTTSHAPTVYAVDHDAGALLIEAIEPGDPLDESTSYPGLTDLAEVLRCLHISAAGLAFPPLADRVAALFDSGTVNYERQPSVVDRVPPVLYEAGRRLATRLAETTTADVLLHGDLTPRNIIAGGPERGLVALDPAPCIGDAGFDAVDLVFWLADDVTAITSRIPPLAAAIDVDAERMLDWCVGFAAMTALEQATSPDAHAPEERISEYVDLARRAVD